MLEIDERNVASTSNMSAHNLMRPASRINSLIKDAQSNSKFLILLLVYKTDLVQELELDNARRTLTQARKDSQIAFQKYSNLLESERRAQNSLSIAEDRRSEISKLLLYKVSYLS